MILKMIKDIFGATVPSLQDSLTTIFLPQGSFILYNLILISVGLIIFLISLYLYSRYVERGEISLKNFILPILLIFLVGFFNTFMLGVVLLLLILFSISYLLQCRKLIGKEELEEKRIESPQKLKIGVMLFILLNIGLLALFSIGGLLFSFLLAWWIYGFTLQIGAIVGIIIFLIKKFGNFQILNIPTKLSSRSIRNLKGIIIIITVFFGSIFVISLIPLSHSSAPDSPTNSEPTNLRIMTYNIRRSGTEEDPKNSWINRKEEFVRYLDEFDLDVFGLQEAKFFQVQYIFNNLKSREYSWTGKARDNGVYAGEACPIFFDREKYKLLDEDTFWLSGITHYPTNTWEGSCYRVVTWVRLEVKNGENQGEEFFVFNTHFDFGDEWQMKASKLVSDKITELSGGLPTILMGDFNLRNNTKQFEILENYENPGDSKPMRDAYRVFKEDELGYLPYATTSGNDWDIRTEPENQSRIDFIFISKTIAVNRCSIPKDSYHEYRTYSDHYPVYMNCTF